ncbi:hypothetical protein [Faecalibacterium prausnitzii]|uniref:hypothetical protein n=1 Tax=Faecalibacterium prausnitzii TaxID=853 RepID=UPI002930E9D3|nr:hypothetical protein [Faecalibacterium prausnitzii]
MRAAAFFGRVDDFEWLPLRFSHFQRKYYFKFRDIGTPAGVPISHFHRRSRGGKLPVNRCALPHEKGLGRYQQRRAFAESGAANAVCRRDPSCEKVNRENPQIFPIYK